MSSLIHSTTGLFHVIMALFAMLAGTIVVVIKKGTPLHRFLGYFYFFSMLAMNGSSFFLFGLFGGVGPFHFAALFSLATLMAGIIPVLVKRPTGAWLRMHGSFMYFSVVGLYAAFFSEIVTRIPGQSFPLMVSIATISTITLGFLIFNRFKERWFVLKKAN